MSYIDDVKARAAGVAKGYDFTDLDRPGRYTQADCDSVAATQTFLKHARADVPELVSRIEVAAEILHRAREDVTWHDNCQHPGICKQCDAYSRICAALAVLDRLGPA